MLSELVNNKLTDKNTDHSYLDLYYDLLCSKKETAKNILEVGIYRGGSIKLWHDFFDNAMIYGLDRDDIDNIYMTNEIKNKELQIIPVYGFPITSDWRLVWLKNKSLSPVAQAYLDYIKKEKEEIAKNYFSWIHTL